MDFTGHGMSRFVLGSQILGTEESTIDDKGRVRVSRKKQYALGEKFVLCLRPTGCLAAYPTEVWNSLVGEILQLPASSPDRELQLRELGAFAEDDIRCDQQGRFVIPFRLRKAAGLETQEVLLVGCVDHMEIWPPEEFAKYRQSPEEYAKDKREYMERIWSRMMAG